MVRPNNLRALFDQCPPFLIPALARKADSKLRGMSIADIAKAAGISRRSLTRLFAKLDWRGVKVYTACRVLAACNIDPLRMSDAKEYIRDTSSSRTPFRHLRHGRSRRVLLRRMAQFVEATPAADRAAPANAAE